MPINTLINYGSFAILTILWLAFGAALLFNQALLDSIWQSFRAFPLIAQLGIGLLLLPKELIFTRLLSTRIERSFTDSFP